MRAMARTDLWQFTCDRCRTGHRPLSRPSWWYDLWWSWSAAGSLVPCNVEGATRRADIAAGMFVRRHTWASHRRVYLFLLESSCRLEEIACCPDMVAMLIARSGA